MVTLALNRLDGSSTGLTETLSIPANGQTAVQATQGTAGLHDTVTIVNVTTGQITPVLLNPNGGFTTTVAASANDKLRLRIQKKREMRSS